VRTCIQKGIPTRRMEATSIFELHFSLLGTAAAIALSGLFTKGSELVGY
jgi:hypothetical protein